MGGFTPFSGNLSECCLAIMSRYFSLPGRQVGPCASLKPKPFRKWFGTVSTTSQSKGFYLVPTVWLEPPRHFGPLNFQYRVLTISVRWHLVGRVGVEPTEGFPKRFTVSTATSYGIPAHISPGVACSRHSVFPQPAPWPSEQRRNGWRFLEAALFFPSPFGAWP